MQNLFRLIRPYIKALPLIVLIVVAGILIARKYLSYTTPIYEATAKLRLADVNEGIPNGNLFKDLDVFVSSNKIAAEIEVLKSDVLLEKVIDSLHLGMQLRRVGKIKSTGLYKDAPLQIAALFKDDDALDKIFRLSIFDASSYRLSLPNGEVIQHCLGEPLHTSYGTLLISANDDLLRKRPLTPLADEYEFEYYSHTRLLADMNAHLDIVSTDKEVAILRINYRSSSPEKSADIANSLATAYIRDYIENRQRTAKITTDFLDDRIREMAGKLAAVENEIRNYRDEKHITNLRQETETDLRKISQLRIQETNVKMNLDAINELQRYMQQGSDNFLSLAPNFEAFNDLLSTEMIKKIKTLQAEKTDLLLTYTPEDDKVKAIDDKIKDHSSYLIESVKNTQKNLEIKYASLREEIAEAEKVFIGIPEKERLLTIMNRDFEIYQSSFNFLNEKKIEAEIAKAAKIAFHRIITPAKPALLPVSPNSSIILIVSAILSLLLALALVTLIQHLFARVSDPILIEKNAAHPVAATTPFFDHPGDIAPHFIKMAIQWELRHLLSPAAVLAFSDAGHKGGSEFYSHHLAIALARRGKRVLIASRTRMDGESIPAAHPGVDSICLKTDTLSLQQMAGLTAGWKAKYDAILLCNGALEDEGEELLFMRAAEANMVIIDSRHSPINVLQKTDMLCQNYQLPQPNFVLNRYGYSRGIFTHYINRMRRIFSMTTPAEKMEYV